MTERDEMLALADMICEDIGTEQIPELTKKSWSLVVDALRRAAPAATGDVREAIRRAALEWFATGLIDESDKRAVTSFARWLTESAALSAAPVERGREERKHSRQEILQPTFDMISAVAEER